MCAQNMDSYCQPIRSVWIQEDQTGQDLIGQTIHTAKRSGQHAHRTERERREQRLNLLEDKDQNIWNEARERNRGPRMADGPAERRN